jgi:hypothetical protein
MATWSTKDYGFGSGLKSPDYSGAFGSQKDGAFSNAWKTGFGVSDTKPQNNREELFGKLFDKAKDTDKYRDEAKRASFGEAIRGSGGQILENLSALYPQQHSPMFIPGETSQGVGGSTWHSRWNWSQLYSGSWARDCGSYASHWWQHR